MSRQMYDSTDPNAIPANAQMVAGYIDGTSFRWPESAWNRFSNSTKVRIARRVSTNDGHVLDVEVGIPTVWPPSQAIVQWVQMRRLSGVEPTIYCNQLNDWNPIRTLFQKAGVREPQWWVARYNNVQDIPVGAIAKQYANPPLHGRGHFDLSVVADYWPGVDEGVDMTPDQDNKLTQLYNCHLVTASAPMGPGGKRETVHDAIWQNRAQLSETLNDAVKSAVEDYFANNPPTVTVDYAAIAKAVNDDAARRQAE